MYWRLGDERVRVTFVEADPPRRSWLAMWSADAASDHAHPASTVQTSLDSDNSPDSSPDNSSDNSDASIATEANTGTDTTSGSQPIVGDRPVVESAATKSVPTSSVPTSSVDLVELNPDEVIDIVRPTPSGDAIERVATPVERLSIEDLLGQMAEPSLVAAQANQIWIDAAQTALTFVAQGRIQPGLSTGGFDAWRLGAPTDDERQHIRDLARALEPLAHAEALGPPDDLNWVATPEATIEAFMGAVVDRFARTASAPLVAGHDAFASLHPTPIDAGAALTRLANVSGDRPPLTFLRLVTTDSSFAGALVFQGRHDPSVTVPVSALWNAPDSVRRRFQAFENSLLLTLRRAAKQWEPLSRLLAQATPTELTLSSDEVDALSGPLANDLGALGLSIAWPTDAIAGITLTPVVGPPADADAIPLTGRTTRLDLASLLELRWQGEIDGEPLTAEEIELLASSNHAVVRLRGRWVRVEGEQMVRLRERRTVGAGTALAVALGGQVDLPGATAGSGIEPTIHVVGPLAALGERLRGLESEREISPPPGFTAELRAYQSRGLAWLVEMDELGLGGVLADDMGLGKTVQLLALHAYRQHELGRGSADVADPDASSTEASSTEEGSTDASAGEEAAGPTLVICPTSVVGNWERETNRFSPSTKVLRYHGATRSLKPEDIESDTVVLTSYGVARRDAETLGKIGWGLVVADEAQAIKNPRSRTARALRSIPSGTRFALTGTPIQNQLLDLWAILDWTTPGLLGPQERFRQDLAAPIERDGDADVTAQLNRLLRPFLLRRRKSDPDIAPDLPPKTETDQIVPLTEEQASLYAAVVADVMAEIGAATGIERRGLVLRLVTRLKQVCNHPEHLLAEGGELNGRSGKLTAADDLLDVIVEEGEAAIVFTQYVRMGELLETHFAERGLRTLFLHGGLSAKQRETMVDTFQSGEIDVFVVSLRAGGTGLNLTAATHVIHYDRWWNPAVEDQASDRAWRIGQTKPVQVHRLICEGTIEDRIAVLLREKRSVASAVVGAGEAWISDLGDADLAELVALSTDGEAW